MLDCPRRKALPSTPVPCALQVYRRAAAVYGLYDTCSRYSEWPQLQQDLLELARPGPAARRLLVHQRMMATYTICKP
jgi:hypothetical protein